MIVEFTIPKAIQSAQLWDYGFFMAKTFINALNIATHGLFWWYVPKDIEKFYDEITDLEVDKTGNTKLHMVIGKRLALAWDDMRMVLDENEMQRVMVVYPFLMRESRKLKEFLETYAFALTVLSKIDIHFRLEANAFNEFFKAFKAALIAFGDWDGKSDLKVAILNQFKSLGDFKELDAIIQTGIDFDPSRGNPPNITLTEVAAMKLYCDVYIQLKAKEYMEKFAAENN
jgi:hypothetical protein